MPIDPRELRPSKNALVELITTDRLCGRCRYNLKGLPSNGKCPECGKPIASLRSGKRTFTDNLADAPLFYLKALAMGLVLMALFSTASVSCFLWFAQERTLTAAGCAAMMGIGWWVGVYIVTAQRSRPENALDDEVLDSGSLRLVNRVLQLAWTAAPVAWAGALLATPPLAAAPTDATRWLYFAGSVFSVVGLAGLVPLAVYLSSLAYWANDTSVGERLRFVAWGIAVMGVLVLIGGAGIAQPGVARGLLYLLAVWSSIGLVAAEAIFLLSLVQLGHEAIWAVRNCHTASGVALRIEQRRNDPRARACDKCGYDLSGLDVFNPCPECGHMDAEIKRSGLAALRATRRAAERDARPQEVVPLEPAGGQPRPIRFIGRIAAGRIYPPKRDP